MQEQTGHTTSDAASSEWLQDRLLLLEGALITTGCSERVIENVTGSIKDSWVGFDGESTQKSACTQNTADSLLMGIGNLNSKANLAKALLKHHSQLSYRCPEKTLTFVISVIQCLRSKVVEEGWGGSSAGQKEKNEFDRCLHSFLVSLQVDTESKQCQGLRESSRKRLHSASGFMDDVQLRDVARIAYAIEAVLKNEWRDPLEYFNELYGHLHFVCPQAEW